MADWLGISSEKIFPFQNNKNADPDYELPNSRPLTAKQQRELTAELHAAYLCAHDEQGNFLGDRDSRGRFNKEQSEAVTRYLNTRRTFIERYAWLPYRIANSLRSQCHKVSLTDLMQQAFIGLTIAVDKNQFRDGVLFSGYATTVIVTNLHQWLDLHARTNSLPSEKVEFFLSRITWETLYHRVRTKDKKKKRENEVKRVDEFAIVTRSGKRASMLHKLAKELELDPEEFIGSTVAEILLIHNAIDIGSRIAGLDAQSTIGIISQMANNAERIAEFMPAEEGTDLFLMSARRTLMEEIIENAGTHGWIIKHRHIEGASLNEIREKYVDSGRSRYGTCTRTRVRKMIKDAHKFIESDPTCRKKLEHLHAMGQPGFDADGDKYVQRERERSRGCGIQ
jgi:hypothetical protein